MPSKRPASSSASASTSKKTRFVDPAEDPANFADQIDSALETPYSSRKGRVRNEGYDSDSTDDGEGVVFSRKKENDDDEDDDMFASEPKESEVADDTTKKKKREYLRLGDIEGQEFNGSGSEDDLSDDPEDEDDAERRKKAGMGFELSSFNMREEMEEGAFTEDGNYVRARDPHGVHDRWMDGLDEREIKKARRRKRDQERIQREKLQAEDKEIEESGGMPQLQLQLLSMLKKGETVLDALQRLGARKSKKAQGAVAEDVKNTSTDIENITHLAAQIMSLGDSDVYSKTYEEIVRAVRASATVEPSWEPPSADKKYQYKWATPSAGQESEIFGPFGEDELKAWYKASYFGLAGEKVKLREVGKEWGDWDDVLL